MGRSSHQKRSSSSASLLAAAPPLLLPAPAPAPAPPRPFSAPARCASLAASRAASLASSEYLAATASAPKRSLLFAQLLQEPLHCRAAGGSLLGPRGVGLGRTGGSALSCASSAREGAAEISSSVIRAVLQIPPPSPRWPPESAQAPGQQEGIRGGCMLKNDS